MRGLRMRRSSRRGMFITAAGCRRCSSGPAGAHPRASSATFSARTTRLARDNRRAFAARGVFALNFVSSPGSGKTSLLVKTIEQLKGRAEVAVIEGDQQTSNDAERIRAAGAPAIQINTGKGCHLDAQMVGHAFDSLEPRAGRGAVHRERRQPRLPRRLRSRRSQARRRAVGDRGRRQADQISRHVRLRRPHAGQQVRICCRYRRFRCRQTVSPTPCGSIRGCRRCIVSARSGEGLDAFVAWIEAQAAEQPLGAGA